MRHRGTIGGSIANNDPAADYPAAALALGATIKTDRRSIKADDFFTGMFSTALEQGELITAVEFPVPTKAAYEKFRNPASRYAIVGVFVAQTPVGVRVAVTGAGQGGVFRHAAMEQALAANFSAAAIKGIKTSPGRSERRYSRQFGISCAFGRRDRRPCGGQSGMSEMPDLQELVARPGANSLAWQDPAFPGQTLFLHAARPQQYTPRTPLLFVHHGVGRNGAAYRDYWLPLVEQHDLLAIAIEFPEDSFPGLSALSFRQSAQRGRHAEPARAMDLRHRSAPVRRCCVQAA